MRHREQIADAAATLARSNPVEWRNFLQALDVLKNAHRDELVTSPIDTMQVAQGRAQGISSLCDVLKDAINIADKIKGK